MPLRIGSIRILPQVPVPGHGSVAKCDGVVVGSSNDVPVDDESCTFPRLTHSCCSPSHKN